MIVNVIADVDYDPDTYAVVRTGYKGLVENIRPATKKYDIVILQVYDENKVNYNANSTGFYDSIEKGEDGLEPTAVDIFVSNSPLGEEAEGIPEGQYEVRKGTLV